MKLSKPKKPLVITTAGILSAVIIAGAIYLIPKQESGFSPAATATVPPAGGWEEGNKPQSGSTADIEPQSADSLADKLRRLAAGDAVTAYAVSGDPEYTAPDTAATEVSYTKKPLPDSGPVITDLTGGNETVPADENGKPIKPDGHREEIPLPAKPPAASGVTPQDSDWIGINMDMPQELYRYDYTIVPGFETLTGKQIQYMNYTDMDAATEAVKRAAELRYNFDYRKILTTDVFARDPYLCALVGYCGESSQYDIANYIAESVNNKVISTAEFLTDKTLFYSSFHNVVRGRLAICFESGAQLYGLENGRWYYNDLELAVKKNNGEDRFGYGQTNAYHCIMFLNRGFVSLSGGFRPL